MDESFESFLKYFESIRKRTLRVVRCIPPDQIDWAPKEGKFSFADLIRHLAAIERYMYAENAKFRQSCYSGHGKELADGYEQVLKFLDDAHKESMEIFRTVSDEDLQKKCITPSGSEITLWKWLRAMIEHEVHHRGQIYLYLQLLGVPSPPLYGLTSEEVRERSIH
ncbi:MAG TPA: DinB family protein [Acidobacteriota bacterium]|nr:DinB family protein [Acidobacteriota bacterium]